MDKRQHGVEMPASLSGENPAAETSLPTDWQGQQGSRLGVEGTPPRACGLLGARHSDTLSHETQEGKTILLPNRSNSGPRRFPHSDHQPLFQPTLCPVPELPQSVRAHLV